MKKSIFIITIVSIGICFLAFPQEDKIYSLVKERTSLQSQEDLDFYLSLSSIYSQSVSEETQSIRDSLTSLKLDIKMLIELNNIQSQKIKEIFEVLEYYRKSNNLKFDKIKTRIHGKN